MGLPLAVEALERPVAARVHRSARVFASVPTSAGLVLLVGAVLGLVCANTPVAHIYARVMDAHVAVGPVGSTLSLAVHDWLSEGLLSIFFLLVGLEIRREMTTGALAERRAAVLPIVAALGGAVTPALIYLSLNRGAALCGMGFTLGLLMTDRAFMPAGAAIAKLAVLAGSTTAGVLGALVLRYRTVPITPTDP